MEPTPRSRIRRRPQRAAYDTETIYRILDEALICHLGFVRDELPVVIPTIHARLDDVVYVHGSPAAGFVRDLGQGAPVCLTATIVDGIVLARSANLSSMNYRSVVVHGTATEVTDGDEKLRAFEAVTEHVAPGRWPFLRPVTQDEIRTTAVLRVAIDEASAKIRTGGSHEPDEDRALPIWAGVLPLAIQPLAWVTDPDVPDGIGVPEHVARYRR